MRQNGCATAVWSVSLLRHFENQHGFHQYPGSLPIFVKYCDLTLRSAEENLACDEALLDFCQSGGCDGVLRFWEPNNYFVALGYANRAATEVNLEFCRSQTIPVLRRCSGGGTVLQGPGCLNYSLILRIDSDPALQTVTGTNRFVMERNRAALETLLARSSRRKEALSSESEIRNPKSEISVHGYTDLAIDDRKFSGNAQRRKRGAVLFHGTFLLNFNLALANRLLPMPSKEPDYRKHRSHGQFLMNLAVPSNELKPALRPAWSAVEELKEFPEERTRKLVEEKYSSDAWNLKF